MTRLEGTESAEASALSPLSGLSSRSDLVAEAIRDAILQGRFSPGALLVERKVASMLGVSKTPVREALIVLARRGLVTISPNRGVSVRVIDAPALRSIYEVRLQLEPWAVGRTMESCPEEAASQGRDVLNEARDAIERDDTPTLTVINRRFHRCMYAGCGNELTISILDDMQDQVALGVVSLLWRQIPTWQAEFTEHEAVCDAAASHGAPGAQERMREHVERSLQKVKALCHDAERH